MPSQRDKSCPVQRERRDAGLRLGGQEGGGEGPLLETVGQDEPGAPGSLSVSECLKIAVASVKIITNPASVKIYLDGIGLKSEVPQITHPRASPQIKLEMDYGA